MAASAALLFVLLSLAAVAATSPAPKQQLLEHDAEVELWTEPEMRRALLKLRQPMLIFAYSSDDR